MLSAPEDRRRLATDATAESLSPNLRYVCERAWRLGFGTIRGLHVRAGDPLLDPPPSVVHTFRCDPAIAVSSNTPTPAFAVTREHLALKQTLAAIDHGVVDVVKVHDRLPVRLEMSEPF